MDPRYLSMSQITVRNPDLKNILGEIQFFSITYRLFKIENELESACEDYGQGTI